MTSRRGKCPLSASGEGVGGGVDADGGVAFYVSTGHLPSPARTQALLADAYERFRHNQDGAISTAYPALAAADPDLFGISLAGTHGERYSIGDTTHEFPIMSVAKPFVFALVCDAIGPDAAREAIGVNATGLPFNAVEAVEHSSDGRTNPMVNPGAIATTSLIPGDTLDSKWRFIHEGLSRFAGHPLELDHDLATAVHATNEANRDVTQLLHARGRLASDPDEALTLYARQCSLRVTAADLALMGATLADGGINPITRKRVLDTMTCHYTLAVMATAGLYETSGDWLYTIGLPGKSGIGGGIVTVSPGKGGLGTYAPRLDATGNSIKGRLVAQYLSHALGLDLFLSSPTTRPNR